MIGWDHKTWIINVSLMLNNSVFSKKYIRCKPTWIALISKFHICEAPTSLKNCILYLINSTVSYKNSLGIKVKILVTDIFVYFHIWMTKGSRKNNSLYQVTLILFEILRSKFQLFQRSNNFHFYSQHRNDYEATTSPGRAHPFHAQRGPLQD